MPVYQHCYVHQISKLHLGKCGMNQHMQQLAIVILHSRVTGLWMLHSQAQTGQCSQGERWHPREKYCTRETRMRRKSGSGCWRLQHHSFTKVQSPIPRSTSRNLQSSRKGEQWKWQLYPGWVQNALCGCATHVYMKNPVRCDSDSQRLNRNLNKTKESLHAFKFPLFLFV